MRAFLILFGVCGLLGFLAVGEWPRTAERPGLHSGRVEADALLLSSEVGGTLAELHASEGQWVKAGETVALLDVAELAAARDRAAAVVGRSRARERATSESAELAQRTVELELAQSREAAERATQTARVLELGARAETVARLRVAVAQARALSDEAGREAERLDKLSRGGSLPAQQLDRARTELLVRRQAVVSAQAALDEALAGNRPEEVAAARAEARRLELGRELAQAGLVRRDTARREVEAAHSERLASEADLRLAQTRLAKAKIVAPREGLIDEVIRRPGEVVRPGDAVVRLLDLDHPYVKVFVASTVLERLKAGSKVTVQTDGPPPRSYPGRIEKIARRAEFTPKDVQTRERRVSLVYEVKVAVDGAQRELRAGEPADVAL